MNEELKPYAKVGVVGMDKQKEKTMKCIECDYLKQSEPNEEKIYAICEETGEQLNPFELCYSTGIGKHCPYHKNA